MYGIGTYTIGDFGKRPIVASWQADFRIKPLLLSGLSIFLFWYWSVRFIIIVDREPDKFTVDNSTGTIETIFRGVYFSRKSTTGVLKARDR